MKEASQAAPCPRGLVYRDLVARLRDADVATPDLDARLIMSAATGIDAVALIADPDMLIDEDGMAALEHFVTQRIAGMPVSRMVGVREFWGLDFSLNSATLDPRPDSETLVDAVLETVADKNLPLKLLDFGTGTGCLLLALLSELPNAQGVGIDCSEKAVGIACENASQLGLFERTTFQVGDWGAGLDGVFDLIVSNPPYICSHELKGLTREVREHDPRLALDGGMDGLEAYRRLLPDMMRLLVPGGYGFLEFGVGQSGDVSQLARAVGLRRCAVKTDLGGLSRVLIVNRSL